MLFQRRKNKRKGKIPAGDAFTSRGRSSGLLLHYGASGVNKKGPAITDFKHLNHQMVEFKLKPLTID